MAVVSGLDRTACLQGMLARPLVAAPFTGWLLGAPLVGLEIGTLLELLWLSRLPVGAAIPHDDTQVAVGATVLVVTAGPLAAGLRGLPLVVLCLLLALPLGKLGQYCDRFARQRNQRLIGRTEVALAAGQLGAVERSHFLGLGHFVGAALASYLSVVACGTLLLWQLAPLLAPVFVAAAPWLRLAFFLVGSAVLINTLNLRRALPIFATSFAAALLLFWFFAEV
ncbi:MAG: hypothetical protein A2091_12065 [Desulfuromonadales bacterium GWD2_61_12]|nr:MAG: hypothetical protein A2005_00135 [Desulfuromonadales bacterium GWC2_61_20]OGR36860.1 MAG: hypothetical protein A2091_12065 [Desulfuromonadales bacterium GWD2_61_12]HAD03763.1 hypothetical protein [Desulfuromonas sp.]HBT82273.1 hypothetical protein [Desulfuromonas sp.]